MANHKQKNKIKKGIILADLQYPFHNIELLNNVEKYMASQKWDYLLYLGDILDMDALSHHAFEEGNMRALEGKRLIEDYNNVSQILERHRKIVGHKCEIIFFIGNHEEWAAKFLDKYPQLIGLLEPENNLPFKELNIKVIKPRHYHKINKIYFVHGDFQQGYISRHHAMKMVETFNRNVVYGHHHSLQAFTKISPAGIDETHTAYCIPCLGDTSPEWAKDRPNAWLNGFGIFYTTQDTFTIVPIVSAKGNFISPEGVLWK